MRLDSGCESPWIEWLRYNEVVLAIAGRGNLVRVRRDIDHVGAHLLPNGFDDFDACVIPQPIVSENQLRLRKPCNPQCLRAVLGDAGNRETKVPNDLLQVEGDENLVLDDKNGSGLIPQRQQGLAVGAPNAL